MTDLMFGHCSTMRQENVPKSEARNQKADHLDFWLDVADTRHRLNLGIQENPTPQSEEHPTNPTEVLAWGKCGHHWIHLDLQTQMNLTPPSQVSLIFLPKVHVLKRGNVINDTS